MSLWRKEASKHLPELQGLIASPNIDNPMMLWIELQIKFESFCKQEPLPLNVINRIWSYAKWCMKQGHEDVATAAALGFCEHLLDETATRKILPKIMARQDYDELKALLLYHNSEEDFAEVAKLFESSVKR